MRQRACADMRAIQSGIPVRWAATYYLRKGHHQQRLSRQPLDTSKRMLRVYKVVEVDLDKQVGLSVRASVGAEARAGPVSCFLKIGRYCGFSTACYVGHMWSVRTSAAQRCRAGKGMRPRAVVTGETTRRRAPRSQWKHVT